MKKTPKRPTLRVAVKYGLLQLPGQVLFVLILLLARQWVDIPGYVLIGLISLSVGKDIVLFPFLWRYYDASLFPDRFDMIGRTGFALSRLDPEGFVRVRGERWRAGIAADEAPVEKGTAICVDGIEGLRLTVRPCEEDNA
jgi:membrane-bound serine protease (ClpP class)